MPTPKAGYFLADGSRVPGVTTILGRWKESGGLLQWAFARGKAGDASLYEQRDAAADIGTMAHAMCDAHILGKDVYAALLEFRPTEEQIKQADTAFAAFVEWLDAQNGELISAEVPMVSEKHRYGGTPDFLIRRRSDGRLAMGDLKTSNGIYRDYLLQVAAYGILWDEHHPEDQINGGFHVLRLGKDAPDFEHRFFSELDEAGKLFLLLRDAYDLDASLKKRCR